MPVGNSLTRQQRLDELFFLIIGCYSIAVGIVKYAKQHILSFLKAPTHKCYV